MDNELFFGIRLKKTGEMLSSQIAQILSDKKIEFEPRGLYLLIILQEKGHASIKEITAILRMTHPAIVQMVNSLNNIELITQSKSVDDKRITLIELTEKGKEELNRIKPVLTEIENALESINNEIDVNLKYSLSKLNEATKSKLLILKVKEGLKQKAIQEINIVPYNRKYKSDFAKLNYEWLEKYFEIDIESKRTLKNPEKDIIKKGGEIFFAILNEYVVGTCAVSKIDNSAFKITNICVTEEEKGRQIGKKLALTSIGYAVEKDAERISININNKLNTALNLFRGLGFKEVKKAQDNRNKGELIFMELNFKI
ncbi:MAG: MarR family transcriptional regulator [Bacteroidetes bacterium]|nr:MarR family transcriptional regulator [Bacteroidota bacterium]